MVVVFVLVVVSLGLIAIYNHVTSSDPVELAAYSELRAAGSSMPLSMFHAIREKNRKEQERFGNGTNAPRWPKNRSANATLHRGVWVDDFIVTPSDTALDAFRIAYWKSHRVITFTIVEGEQVLPCGPSKSMIRVRARQGASGLSSWPTVEVRPVHQDDGTWASSYAPAVLPMEMSIVVDAPASADARGQQ